VSSDVWHWQQQPLKQLPNVLSYCPGMVPAQDTSGCGFSCCECFKACSWYVVFFSHHYLSCNPLLRVHAVRPFGCSIIWRAKDIDRFMHGWCSAAAALQQWHAVAERGQCHVVSWCRKLNTDLFLLWQPVPAVYNV